MAILVTFDPRPDRTGLTTRAERRLAHTRIVIVDSLLAASFFTLVMVITVTIAQVINVKNGGNSVITTLIEGPGRPASSDFSLVPSDWRSSLLSGPGGKSPYRGIETNYLPFFRRPFIPEPVLPRRVIGPAHPH